LPTDAIGFSYPMTQTSFIDQNGVYLGLNTNSTPMFLDVCDRNKRASGNMCILGTTGSRKSTLIKIMILQ
jgi:type IV secretory pathway VirB4 component